MIYNKPQTSYFFFENFAAYMESRFIEDFYPLRAGLFCGLRFIEEFNKILIFFLLEKNFKILFKHYISRYIYKKKEISI